jgi:hypothetical protein
VAATATMCCPDTVLVRPSEGDVLSA